MQYLTSLKPSNFINFQSNNNSHLELLTLEDEEQGKVKPFITKLKVLVVEDDPINQYVAKSLLENKGYQVDIAATGQAALNLYQANHYAVILMDMGLPDIQGTDVTRQIRILEQDKGQHTPIIALTANGLSAKPECLAAGMDDFSGKPFEIETLNQLIKVWIGKSN